MITCKEVVRHNIKVVQKENLQKKICPQNLQNFTEMIRNNNLQMRFTEPHYEKKFPEQQLAKNVSTQTICQKKSCRQDNNNQKQIAKKLSGRTICKQAVWNNKDIHNDNFKKYSIWFTMCVLSEQMNLNYFQPMFNLLTQLSLFGLAGTT